MKLNYPGSRFTPMTEQYLWTEFHPLAMFNCNSLFHRFRAEVDHEVVFREYLHRVREHAFFMSPASVAACEQETARLRNAVEKFKVQTAEVPGLLRTRIAALRQRLEDLMQVLTGLQAAPLRLAAAGESGFVTDAADTGFRVPDGMIESPDRDFLTTGIFRMRVYGLPRRKPCALFLIDPEAAAQLCEAAGHAGPVTEESLRHALSDPILRENDEVALILAGVPSGFATSNDNGCAEFLVRDVPRGSYDLPPDHWRIACYAAL